MATPGAAMSTSWPGFMPPQENEAGWRALSTAPTAMNVDAFAGESTGSIRCGRALSLPAAATTSVPASRQTFPICS